MKQIHPKIVIAILKAGLLFSQNLKGVIKLKRVRLIQFRGWFLILIK